jgi:hypothetical protein
VGGVKKQRHLTASAIGFHHDSRIGGNRHIVTGFFPASGNCDGTTLNNRGSNGNYWSSSFNNATNAYNLNFNSSNVNPQNNNNRRNGLTVRAVQHSSNRALYLMTRQTKALNTQKWKDIG